ncbi:MAG: CDP-alcohol phosphatidyltransferase family protein [Rhodospirillales bacterium]|jgi:phosphatidylglycerophosphate synthase|nr:CDP-alcohol phosphatidyltransferase family protein [Rhodospirillales bacterium]
MPVFPLIRHVSARVTPVLLRTPVSANQVTALSLVFGLAGVACMAVGDWHWSMGGAVLLIVDYILDNCDGEIARFKDQCSDFGRRFDSFVDWIVHAAFFAALGYGVSQSTGQGFWLWLGMAAMVGATVNFAIGQYFDRRAAENNETTDSPEESADPSGLGEWVLFAFRELSRADFCFLVLILAVFDLIWVLVPLGAIGAQAYWITQFFRATRKFHV